ncbi:Ku protein [Starkeya koreensis]|uniref:Non-homologous end joining protein Ku n=1 Tax=Ancylobacter koreensis TaxID=266121 RepID=A0ABT0DMM9_9HYPH|nr:Ku protein [Ancylobacter koreensis]MCK0208536.1 Ku protein [Ancylobacter koreensis]
MVARATWKGYLKLGELVSAVALYTGVSASERVALHMVNRRTGNRLSRRFIDPQTGDEVPRDEQVKGYEVASDEYIVLEPEEVAAVTPQGDRTLSIENFVPCGKVDDLYFERPYYLHPAADASQASFAVIREGLRAKKVVAIATAVLFRRPRTLLIRAYDEGLVATTLHYDYEVRSAAEAFEEIGEVKIEREMLDLARHIIKTKTGDFRPEAFEDRYDDALAELVRAKLEGRKIRAPKKPAAKVVSLMDALRESAGIGGKVGKADAKKAPAKKAPTTKAASGKSPARKASATAAAGRTPTRKAG